MIERIDDLNISYQIVTDNLYSLEILTPLIQVKNKNLFGFIKLFNIWVKIFTY